VLASAKTWLAPSAAVTITITPKPETTGGGK